MNDQEHICDVATETSQLRKRSFDDRKWTTIKRKFCLNIRGFVACLAALQFVQVMGSGPRAIAIGSVVMAISSFLSSMPQFIGERYRPPHIDYESSLSRVGIRATIRPPENTTQRMRSLKMNGNRNASTYFAHSDQDKTRNMFEPDKAATQYKSSVCSERKVWILSSGEGSRDDGDIESSLYALIAVGGVLKGMGHTPLHPLGMSFIDDYAAQGNSAFYIGVVSALSLLGPAFGFLLGSFTTSLWVDTGWTSSTIRYEDRFDHMWVGAWWIGYLLIAVLLFLAAIPFYWFPRMMNVEDDGVILSCMFCKNELKSEKFQSNKKSSDYDELPEEYYNGQNNDVKNKNGVTIERCRSTTFSALAANVNAKMASQMQRTRSAPHLATGLKDEGCPCIQEKGVLYTRGEISGKITYSIRDFTCTLANLLTDPLFAGITLGYVSLTSFLASSITYMSKYMESQFARSASFANLINGSVNLPLAVLGNVAGGMIMRTKNLNVKQTITLVICALLVTLACIGALLLFECDGESVIGLHQTDTSHCYDRCHCDDEFYPVCDVTTNITYRSACYAGCTQSDDDEVYGNCSCLMGGEKSKTVRKGYCHEKSCSGLLVLFVSMMGIASLSSGMAATPSTLSILRVAPSNDKALAIGVVFVFTRVLAWIPSPIYIGIVIDSSCLLWSQSQESSLHKHCEIYNKRWLRHRMFGAIAIQVICALLFYSLSYYLVVRHKGGRRSATRQNGLLVNGSQNRETAV